MAKIDSTRIATIKANFEGGDKLTEPHLADLIDAIAEAAQEHEHVATGGAGSGTGDASPIANLQHGTAAQRPETPAVGDCYIETDTEHFLACFTAGVWVQIN